METFRSCYHAMPIWEHGIKYPCSKVFLS